jgi:hypothetical protein
MALGSKQLQNKLPKVLGKQCSGAPQLVIRLANGVKPG